MKNETAKVLNSYEKWNCEGIEPLQINSEAPESELQESDRFQTN